MKIVINTCFGGYSLSHEAVLAYCKLLELPIWPERDEFYWNYWTVPPEARLPRKTYNEAYYTQTLNYRDIDRDDPVLVQVVETLGEAAGCDYTKLKVVDIPDDVAWHIAEYDGMECVAENHRVWD